MVSGTLAVVAGRNSREAASGFAAESSRHLACYWLAHYPPQDVIRHCAGVVPIDRAGRDAAQRVVAEGGHIENAAIDALFPPAANPRKLKRAA